MDTLRSRDLLACHCCGLVQRLPELATGARARCRRCLTPIHRAVNGRLSNQRAGALALSALVLYPLALTLPVMTVQRFGHTTEASIWTGSLALLEQGQVFVGVIVLLCSVVLPLLKLLGLLVLTTGATRLSRHHRAWTYRVIEWTGRWGMLDVLLIALVVAWLKIGDLMEVAAGPGALTFTCCVCLSLMASASFDPHALWEGTDE